MHCGVGGPPALFAGPISRTRARTTEYNDHRYTATHNRTPRTIQPHPPPERVFYPFRRPDREFPRHAFVRLHRRHYGSFHPPYPPTTFLQPLQERARDAPITCAYTNAVVESAFPKDRARDGRNTQLD